MKSIEPLPQQIQDFVASEHEGPIFMINLLRYRAQAEYPDGSKAEPCTGREAYARYAAVALQKVAEAGGRPVWLAPVQVSLIAPEGETWDDAVLVEYPSRQAFLEMVSKPDYQAVAVHRTAALEDSRLFAVGPLVSPTGDGSPE